MLTILLAMPFFAYHNCLSSSTTMTLIFIFLSLFSLPYLFAFDPYTKFTKLNLPPGPIGPESVALGRFNQGPYIGVSDGRILKYKGPSVGFQDFAYTSPKRTKQLCDGVTDVNLGPQCGRSLGFSFNSVTRVLYAVDTFFGLSEVGPNGGLGTLVANTADGVPFNFLNGVDCDQFTGDVYITDGSLTFNLINVTTQPDLVRDSSGRLMRFNPRTKEVKVLLKGLAVPVGPAVSPDSSFLLFSESNAHRIVKYWLKGPKANTTEVLLSIPGRPFKIKRASAFGEFWVAVNQDVQRPSFTTPFGYRFNSYGQVLQTKELQGQYYNLTITVLQEYFGAVLFVGSPIANFVGIYSK